MIKKSNQTRCKICKCQKNWKGDDIICPFKKGDKFKSKNFMCGLIDKIRQLCDIAVPISNNIEDNRLHYQYCSDLKYCCIDISNVSLKKINKKNPILAEIGLCLWVGWYKNRGTTDAMWILSNDGKPRQPTLKELSAIIKYYLKDYKLR